MTSDVFRFVTVRPPQRINPERLKTKVVQAYGFSGNESPLHRELRDLRNSEGGRKKMEDRAKQYVSSSEFISMLSEVGLPQTAQLSMLDRWIISVKRPITLDDLKGWISRIFGMDAVQLVASQDYKEIRMRIAESLIAWTISRTDDGRVGPQLISAMRLCGLLERVAASDPVLDAKDTIEKTLRVTVVLPPDLFPLPEPESKERKRLIEAHEEKNKSVEKLHKEITAVANRLEVLRTGAEELTRAYETDLMDRRVATVKAPAVSRPEPTDGSDTSEGVIARALRPLRADRVENQPASLAPMQPKRGAFLSEKHVQKLSDKTKNLLKEFEMSIEAVDAPKAVGQLEKEITTTASKLFGAEGARNLVRIGNTYVPADEYAARSLPVLGERLMPGHMALRLPERPISDISTLPETVGAVRIVGIADLEVVRQDLQKYEPGEVAHIENVLKGEFKERKHRRTRRVEETFVLETERTEETERDLQSTERFELQQETTRTISEQASLEAGVTVSYNGPTVDVTANTEFARDTALEESSNAATSYARDVTERSVARLSERIREERVRRTVEEFEEINTHGIDNKGGTGHIIGIYRWVDKIYEAQVLNYDKRLMLEFVVPEPAAFYRYALSEKRPTGITLEEPEPPMIWAWVPAENSDPFGRSRGPTLLAYKHVPLSPEHITPENYLFWVGKYQVANVEPPPPMFKTVSKAFGVDHAGVNDVAMLKHSAEITIPPGYAAKQAWVHVRTTHQGYTTTSPRYMDVFIGRENQLTMFYNDDWVPESYATLDEETDTVPVALVAQRIYMTAVAIEIMCVRTQALFEAWQMKTYSAIMTSYNELRSRYEDQLRTVQVQEGVAISGRNPLRNREIERTELKKACIWFLMGDDNLSSFDAMRETPTSGYPEMDVNEADKEGRIIQFFEQAFEWRHMTYIFYPYFWGRKEGWPSILQLDDTDPLFGSFLRAGSARIQVSVRPGYENLVYNYVKTMPRPDNPWPDGDPPGIGEPTYLSVVDEMQEQLGREYATREGKISISTGSRTVTGNDTEFTQADIDREILIKGMNYRIADVTSPTELTLTENYRGSDNLSNIPYSISLYKFVGEPWEVRIPTTLVYLQEDAQLPDWTRSQK